MQHEAVSTTDRVKLAEDYIQRLEKGYICFKYMLQNKQTLKIDQRRHASLENDIQPVNSLIFDFLYKANVISANPQEDKDTT
ncbi:hypothetical protein TTHERM_000629959 (macronuclear) [Tetrahymena thermophila SB210]|uniref:Uncharacterized protein n=1 Tax=Tetrahymena thermophila (strain SB210) TaxID=312017 RepID=W7XHI8_TETTS|nr:hypothetical protein TTHERM_000629959 [Tetrahymena thermophila SB210]EWS72574.1 hypothetical protein TTHERM_000629959 [Tetrahymena thermophila SB210]|eukprot:XP_012654857.1 hypothetical protein TTHERM_000629959 [Tetrahymena thermophila SB210]